ncbi:hypothetical protein OIY81_2950 [Cryptosporidium canis]|nr:hypothetical protein OIY81_2950 [Cryptosporidium canis]
MVVYRCPGLGSTECVIGDVRLGKGIHKLGRDEGLDVSDVAGGEGRVCAVSGCFSELEEETARDVLPLTLVRIV